MSSGSSQREQIRPTPQAPEAGAERIDSRPVASVARAFSRAHAWVTEC
jgi:hypothetical protein